MRLRWWLTFLTTAIVRADVADHRDVRRPLRLGEMVTAARRALDAPRGEIAALRRSTDQPPGKASCGRHGISGLRERAHALGGELRISSRPGKGTQVVVLLS